MHALAVFVYCFISNWSITDYLFYFNSITETAGSITSLFNIWNLDYLAILLEVVSCLCLVPHVVCYGYDQQNQNYYHHLKPYFFLFWLSGSSFCFPFSHRKDIEKVVFIIQLLGKKCGARNQAPQNNHKQHFLRTDLILHRRLCRYRRSLVLRHTSHS